MVAEAVREAVAAEETQVPQPEESPPSPPAPVENPEPQAEPQSDVEPNLESVHEEFLRSLGAGEGEQTGNEPEKKLSPEAQAEVDRVLNEAQQTTQKQLRETGILNTFRDNATQLRTWAANKLQPQDTEALVAFFRDYHGVSGQIHRSEAGDQAAVETVGQFYDVMAKELPASKRQGFLNARGTEHKSQADTVKAWLALKTEGMVTKADAATQVKDGVEKYKAFLIEKKLLKGHDAPPAEGGAGAIDSSSDEAKLSDPNTPIEQVIAIRERQKRAGG